MVPRTLPHPGIKTKYSPDDYFAFIPSYVGSVVPGQMLNWTCPYFQPFTNSVIDSSFLAPCFQNNSATLTISGNSSAELTISANEKSSFFCSDGYLIGYVAGFDIKFFEIPYFNHYISWPGITPPLSLLCII